MSSPENTSRAGRYIYPIATVYFAALAVGVTAPALFSPHSVISAPDMDVDRYFYPIRSFTFERTRAGAFPLWNPYTFGGMPTLGNFQYAMLYPPNWLHLVLPVGLAIDVVVTLHLALAGALAAAWCRSRGAGVVAALLGGTVFTLSGPLMTRLYGGHLTFLCVVAWAPLVMLCVDAILERRGARGAVLVGAAAVAMQILGGYPQPAHNTLVVVLIYTMLRFVRGDGTGRPPLIALMFALGAVLAAAQLFPAVDASYELVRGDDVPESFSTSFSLPPENLLTAVVPHVFGDDFTAPYFGRWAVWETSVYVGAVAAVLALVGLLFCGTWRNRALGLTTLLLLALALGQYTPLYPALVKIVPGFEQFRAPARIAFLATLFVAVLAADGFDWLWRATPRGLLRVAGAAVACGLLLVVTGLFVRHTDAWRRVLEWMTGTGQQWPNVIATYDAAAVERSARFASSQLLRAGLSFAEVAVVLALASRRRRRAIAYVLPVLLVGQMWVASEPFRQKFQPYTRAPEDWEATLASLGPDRVLVTQERWLNLPAQLGVKSISGYDPSLSRRWAGLVAPLLGADPLFGTLGGEEPQPSPIWSMLRLRATLPPPGAPVSDPMPPLNLIEEYRAVRNADESLAAVREPSFDPRRVVILEWQPTILPQPGLADAPGDARVVFANEDTIAIVAELRRPAILLVTDAHAAGWRCRARKPGPQATYDVLPANHALRAIPLAAGTHHLTLEYRPRSVVVGAVVSIVAIAGWAAACAVVIRAKRRRATK